MPEPSAYSVLRAKPKLQARSPTFFLSSFYEKMLQPDKLLTVILAQIATMWNQVAAGLLQHVWNGNEKALLYLLLIVFTFVTGARVMQSFYLASRDYQTLQSKPRDILYFLAAIGFTAGGTFWVVPFDKPEWVALWYLFLALIGLTNFYDLYNRRLPKRLKQIDYVIETRIQAVNVLTFVHITAAMACTFVAAKWFPQWMALSYAAVASTFPTLIVNILHSGQLTFMPKFLISNAPDAPDQVIKRFRAQFPATAQSWTDEGLRSDLLRKECASYQPVELIRAEREMARQIATLLSAEFGYVYRHILGTENAEILHKALLHMLTMLGGFGSLGFTRFYAVMNENSVVGFVKLDCSTECVIYRILEPFAMILRLGPLVGWRALLRVYRNSKAILAVQPVVTDHEVCLAYLIIDREQRSKGIGTSVVRLLRNAIKDQANDIIATRITALVRKENAAALAMFTREGFRRDGTMDGHAGRDDPFRDVEGVGEPTYLECDLT